MAQRYTVLMWMTLARCWRLLRRSTEFHIFVSRASGADVDLSRPARVEHSLYVRRPNSSELIIMAGIVKDDDVADHHYLKTVPGGAARPVYELPVRMRTR